jgi:hypothetical protein
MQTQINSNTNGPTLTAAVFTAEVEDFPSWKRMFEGQAQLRRDAGIAFTQISHDISNPKLLTVYIAGPDANRVRAFATSPELKARMQKAGVKGTPQGELLQVVEDMTRRDALAAAIVRHSVSNFDAWKALFDEHAGARASAGIIGHAVSCKLEDRNQVCVYLQASSVETLQKFMSAPQLAEKMKAAGVGKPSVCFVHSEAPQG